METSLQHTQYKGFFKDKSLDKLLKQTTQNSHLIAILPDDQKETFCVLFFLFAIYKNSWKAGCYSLEYRLTLLANAVLHFMFYWTRFYWVPNIEI